MAPGPPAVAPKQPTDGPATEYTVPKSRCEKQRCPSCTAEIFQWSVHKWNGIMIIIHSVFSGLLVCEGKFAAIFGSAARAGVIR
jgi:hypothetical protein